MSTALTVAVVLRTDQHFAGILVLSVIVLCEIVIFALAAGTFVILVDLLFKGLSDALPHPYGPSRSEGTFEKCCSYLGQWARVLIRRPVDLFN